MPNGKMVMSKNKKMDELLKKAHLAGVAAGLAVILADILQKATNSRIMPTISITVPIPEPLPGKCFITNSHTPSITSIIPINPKTMASVFTIVPPDTHQVFFLCIYKSIEKAPFLDAYTKIGCCFTNNSDMPILRCIFQAISAGETRRKRASN
jgi:hypothetical protein